MTMNYCGNALSKSQLKVTDTYSSVLSDLLRQFVRREMQRGISCKCDVYVFKAFDRFLKETCAPENNLTKEIVHAFCTRNSDESEKTYANRVSAIRRFGRFMQEVGFDVYVFPTKAEAEPPRTLHRDITGYTSALRAHLRQFVEQKRGLGAKYTFEPYILSAFDRFLTGHSIPPDSLSKELVEEFCAKRPDEAHATFVLRGKVIRQFGIYMAQIGYESFVLPRYHKCQSSFVPHIYSHAEVERYFEALDAWNYAQFKPYSRYVYPMIFRVLYGCGLRLSEATGLRVCDVDLKNGVFKLLNTKFNSERLVPMSDSLLRECRNYFNAIHSTGQFELFFPSYVADRISQSTIQSFHKQILIKVGIPENARVHDFRHTFAVHSLNQWVTQGMDIYVCLPVLSKYIGHTGPSSTERYLRLTAEVFPEVTQTFEQYFGRVIPEEVNFEED